ncbi:MAG: Sua5/YciO/YrdC/YwlC family protein [Phycisphaeraceae bacterium]
MEVTTIESGNAAQLADVAREAGRVFDSGGLVIFPTETVYGIGASASSDKGFAALLDVKGREQTQPFTIHLPHAPAAGRYVDLTHIRMRRLVEKLFPGPVTLVVDVPEDMMADRLRALEDELGAASLLPAQGIHALGQRLYHSGTIGLRCPDDAVARRILGGTLAPVVASSANKRGQPPPLEIEAARKAVGESAELIVDGGHTRYAKPSTIVRVRYAEGGSPVIKVEREGVYDERTIRRMLRWTMLLVCSGNTCRSPMAEAIAKNMISTERGIKADELEAAGVRILSAGAFTTSGMPAAHEAIDAMNKIGIDLSQHRSRSLSPELIHEADVIYTMTNNHRDAVLNFDREAADKTFTLDPNGDIDDPIGGSLTVYQRCAELIRRRLDLRIREQQP